MSFPTPDFEMCHCGRWALVTRPIPLEEGGFVPPGFLSDGFSCPDLAWPLIRPNPQTTDPHFGVYAPGGIKHDWRYRSKSTPRWMADWQLLQDMLEAIGPCKPGQRMQWLRAHARAKAAYAILCAVGWRYYGKRSTNGCDDPCGAWPACSTRQAQVRLGETPNAR